MASEHIIGHVPDGWEYTTLGAACERGGGGIQTGPFGSQLHASDYVPTGIPSIMPQNIGDNRILEDGIARITPADAERLSRYLLRKGDIVYSRRGDVERRALVREHEDGWLCGTGCLRVRFGKKGVDPRYASFYLGHSGVREWVVRHAHGATMPNLNTSILASCPFVIPPPDEQRAIAHILSTLDDKIELNRRMNETLEAMARALFKSWFVDFDPVHAKAAGRDPSLPKQIADLFPDSFEESELGEVPWGWEVKELGELIETVKGHSYKSEELVDSDTALVTLKSFARGGGYRPDGLKSFAGTYKPEQVVKPGDIVIACTDVTQAAEVIGRAAVVRGTAGYRILVASLDTLIVRPRHPSVTRAFLYFLGGTEAFVAHTYAHTTGTTVLHLAKEAVPSFKVALPSSSLIEAFDSIASLALNRMQAVEEESGTLATLRDTLLPKLISGEMRVKDAERFMGSHNV
jgi:type I restriction enzyme, S subunit